MDEFAFGQQLALSSPAWETQKLFETGPARRGVTETSAAMPGLGKEGDKARTGGGDRCARAGSADPVPKQLLHEPCKDPGVTLLASVCKLGLCTSKLEQRKHTVLLLEASSCGRMLTVILKLSAGE